jgi:DNA-binding NtrC family response regulator
MDLLEKVERADELAEYLRHQLGLRVGQSERMTARLARAAAIGIYSAASRMAFDAIERRVRMSAPLAIRAPSGVDPVPYIARAHLAGPRAEGPLVLVDGTASREHDLERWRDPRISPLALANGGMLVLLDGAALPTDVQQLIGRALAERRSPSADAVPLDIALAFTGVAPPVELVASRRLEESLASRLGDALQAPVELPRLRERAEDLRAILTDRFAREGLRTRGRPVGLDDAAFARFVDYTFPGEDAELAALVQRLVAACEGDVVRGADVDALGLDRIAPDLRRTDEDVVSSLLPVISHRGP